MQILDTENELMFVIRRLQVMSLLGFVLFFLTSFFFSSCLMQILPWAVEGESKCVNEELEGHALNSFPLVNLNSQTSQRAKSLMLKL